MQDRYNEMLVFARVATLGSFSAAARELELTLLRLASSYQGWRTDWLCACFSAPPAVLA